MAKAEGEMTWKEVDLGSMVTEPGSTLQYLTGDWKSQRPILDKRQCNKCGLCYIFCPEGCIKQVADDFFEADLSYCKGCGICATECPRSAITMEEEAG